MKKAVILFALLLLLGQAFGISSYADELPEVSDIEKYIPKEALDRLPEGIFEQGGAADKLSPTYFLGAFLDVLKKATGSAVIELGALASLVVIASLMHNLSHQNAAFSAVSGLCVCISVFGGLKGLFEMTEAYLSTLSSFANAITPAVTALYVLGGNITAGTVSRTGLLLSITLLENINARILYPVLQISLALALARAVSPKLRLGTLSGFVKGVLGVGIGLTVAAISATVAFQNTLAGAADSLASRAVRFAASSFIPIVGGAVSEAVRTVSGSISYLRTTVGGIGIAVIVLIALPPFASLMVTRISLALAASLADLLGCERECAVIKDAGGLVNYLIALVSLMAVLFIYSMTVLAHCASSYA